MMKRGSILLAGILALIQPGSARADERILTFDSDITVNTDTSLTVTETIRVRAEGIRIKRGIFRDFPQMYEGKWGLRRERGFEVLEVTLDGKPEPFVVEEIPGGQRVRIGRASKFLQRGEYEYAITYRTTRQLGYFDKHDELYWNVTGNGWLFPIDRASATVSLPEGGKILSAEAYTGPAGSRGENYRVEKTAEGIAEFETTRPLGEAEGLTVVVTWPKGLVDYSADAPGWKGLFRDNKGSVIGLIGFLAAMAFFFVNWLMVGRDPAKGTIIPLYEPPEGFSPGAVRMLYRMGFDDKTFGAAVIGLAARGALTIEESGQTFKLIRTGEESDLTADEAAFLTSLMGSHSKLKLTQSKHRNIGGGKDTLKRCLKEMLVPDYFVRNTGRWVIGLLILLAGLGIGLAFRGPDALGISVFLAIWSIGTFALVMEAISGWIRGKGSILLTLFSLPFAGAWIFGIIMFAGTAGWPLAIIMAVGLAMTVLFFSLLFAPKKLGRATLDRIEGFKRYLGVAEKDRLNLQNPPERTPELFERFLPYALALDVEQEWSEQFSEVLAAAGRAPGEKRSAYTPSYFSGSRYNYGNLTAGAMAAAIGSTLTSALASASTSPSSSSGSSGGGGGGGSSGGGGGGGGGGGW